MERRPGTDGSHQHSIGKPSSNATAKKAASNSSGPGLRPRKDNFHSAFTKRYRQERDGQDLPLDAP